jgi:hypothetical protein
MKAKNNFGRKTWSPGKLKKFNPDRNYINSAVGEFLKNGGKITHIELDYTFERNDYQAVHEFLMGN